MAEWRDEISFDSLNKVKTTLFKEDGQTYLHHQSDYAPLLEENSRMNTAEQHGKQSRLAARIPPHLYYIDWPTEFQMRHGEHPHRVAGEKRKECRRLWRQFVTAKLNDRNYSRLRVDGGRKL